MRRNSRARRCAARTCCVLRLRCSSYSRKPSSTLLAAAVCVLLALPALADSQARIVRLSDVQGSVQIDKNTGLGFEEAFINLPITQGTQLKTGDRGRAEVEFEDGSSMRLTPNTTVQFNKLGLSDEGKRISEINLVQGMAYVNWLGKDDVSTRNISPHSLWGGRIWLWVG